MFDKDYTLLKPTNGDNDYGVYEAIDVDGSVQEIPVGRVHIEGALRGIAYIEIAERDYIIRRKKKYECFTHVPLREAAAFMPANHNVH